MKNIYLVVPFYNEGKILHNVIKKLKKNFLNIICIDDGSDYKYKLKAKYPGIHLIEHPINLGQGAALQTGIDFALKKKAEIIVTFDSDGQHSCKDTLEMIKLLKKNKLDLVQGSRFLKEKNQIPYVRKLLLKIAIIVSNYFDNTKFTDTHNGLRVFNSKFAKKINIKNYRMSHPHDINQLVYKYKFKFMEYPTNIRYTNYSLSKGQKNINSINILFDILVSKFVIK
jgi:glycosyltransferase involved in cell wall biosynthesis